MWYLNAGPCPGNCLLWGDDNRICPTVKKWNLSRCVAIAIKYFDYFRNTTPYNLGQFLCTFICHLIHFKMYNNLTLKCSRSIYNSVQTKGSTNFYYDIHSITSISLHGDPINKISTWIYALLTRSVPTGRPN